MHQKKIMIFAYKFYIILHAARFCGLLHCVRNDEARKYTAHSILYQATKKSDALDLKK